MPNDPKRSAAAAALFLGLCAGTACADESASEPMLTAIARTLHAGTTLEQVVARVLDPVRKYDLDGDGLDAADVDTAEAMDRASQRARAASYYLPYDLDGDLNISEAEIRGSVQRQYGPSKLTDPDLGAQVEKVTGAMMALDLDGNGALSMPEILEDSLPTEPPELTYEPLRQLIADDPNGNGHLTPAELEGIVRTVFAGLDSSGDGELDDAEFAAHRQSVEQAADAMKFAACKLPRAGAGETVTLLGMGDGDSQPTVTVAGQDGVTAMARIEIEPGTAPLYIILTASVPMIWKIEGEAARLKRLVVLDSGNKGPRQPSWVGVIGLPRDRLTFLSRDYCGSAFEMTWRNAKAMNASIAKAAGVDDAHPTYISSAQMVALPSGKPINAPKQQDVAVSNGNGYLLSDGREPELIDGALSPAFQEGWLGKSGGIVEIDPDSVVSPGKVEPYQVIPGQDGLRRLVKLGVLERTATAYRVVKPLPRWPAGLAGARSVKFILPKGMPQPEGDPGHSTIIVEP